MQFASVEFGIFFLLVLGIYYLVGPKRRWIILLTASAVFCGYSSLWHFIYLMTAVSASFFAAKIISKYHEEEKRALLNSKSISKEEKKELKNHFKKKKQWVIGAVSFLLLAVILVLKLTKKFSLIQQDASGILIPLGISYYTLVMIGYCIDIYREKYPADSNFFKFALTIMYFPSLLQGPINRVDALREQLFQEIHWNYFEVKAGLQRVVWGLFKKLVIADRLAIFVNQIYGDFGNQTGSFLAVGTIAYAIQLYADFSGYMDIAIGISRTFGVKLAENFKCPYFSVSISEFWKKWHITLGDWFKDYLMFPFAMSQIGRNIGKQGQKIFGKQGGKKLTLYLATMLVWFSTGLWHGIEWNFITWGGVYGVIMVLSDFLEPLFEKIRNRWGITKEKLWFRFFCYVRTFSIVCFADILFRAPGLREAFIIIKKILFEFQVNQINNAEIWLLKLSEPDYRLLAGCLILGFLFHLQHKKEKSVSVILEQKNIVLRWILYVGIIWVTFLFGIYGSAYSLEGFAYMQF